MVHWGEHLWNRGAVRVNPNIYIYIYIYTYIYVFAYICIYTYIYNAQVPRGAPGLAAGDQGS